MSKDTVSKDGTDGLVTVHTQVRFGPNDVWRNEVFVGERSRITERRELVTRSQAESEIRKVRKDAEELLAAKNDRIRNLEALLSNARTIQADNAALIHDLNRIKDHETKLVNENAAQAARIKVLEERIETENLYQHEVIEENDARVEALEAKLAAAQKALERFLEAYRIDYDLYGASIEARDVLGGKS